jgi:1-acyl-sn-glycerol-3-phosphate acyltransferase
MKRLVLLLMNIVQWTSFAGWSFFWMSAAILYGLVFRRDQDTPLSWARRFWGAGLVRVARCRLVQHPGFIPEPGKPYFYVMNHQSLFDIVVAFVSIPVNLRYIAKKSLRVIPFLGWYMSVVGMIFIDRKNREEAVRSLDEACQKIRSGKSILVYPEGTRSRDGFILPFKKGPFVMALQAGVPIVPVAIEGCQNLLERDSLVIKGGRVDIAIGQPIPTTGLSLAERDALMVRVRNALIDLHLTIGGRGGDRDHAIAAADRSTSGTVPSLSGTSDAV